MCVYYCHQFPLSFDHNQSKHARAVNSDDFNFAWEAMWRKKKKEEWQKGQDLWSHLASNSFTFCSPKLNIRGPVRAKGGLREGQRTGARGRMSRLTPNPPAKPARLCGTLRPSFEDKGEGLTLARQPPVPGWTLSLLGPFKAALQDHVQALALLRSFKPHHTRSCSPGHAGMWPGRKDSELKNALKWKHR